MPSRPSSEPSLRASEGGPVDMSTTANPDRAPARRPADPRTTSSTAAGEGRESKATSQTAAASLGVAATGAPRSAALAGSTSTATSSCPAATRFRAIGRPIVPSPMNATRDMAQTEPEASSLPKAGSRASGRPDEARATQTTISSSRGASGIRTSNVW